MTKKIFLIDHYLRIAELVNADPLIIYFVLEEIQASRSLDPRLFSAVSADLKRRHYWHPPGQTCGLLPSLLHVILEISPNTQRDAPSPTRNLDHHPPARQDPKSPQLDPSVLVIPAPVLRQASDPHELLAYRSSAERPTCPTSCPFTGRVAFAMR